jgi:hypothetical protein
LFDILFNDTLQNTGILQNRIKSKTMIGVDLLIKMREFGRSLFYKFLSRRLPVGTVEDNENSHL